MVNEILKDIFYVGVNDRALDLFEGMYSVPNGVSYNSYVISDDKIAVMDSVEAHFGEEWLANVKKALKGKTPDYLIVQHMEPDHSANVLRFVEEFPGVTVVGNNKTFVMLGEYFGKDVNFNKLVVADGYRLPLGSHSLTFVFAPMVHWPEVMMTYEESTGTLFSADAFGKFGALDCEEPWSDEARRYYFGIVGKYGVQVQALFKKLAAYSLAHIAPLHGPLLGGAEKDNALRLYALWSGYQPEEEGVLIAYTSVYGHTKEAALLLLSELRNRGCRTEAVDLARDDWSQCVASAFRYSKIVLATTTYNADVFPAMREFIDRLVERNFQNRAVGFIENGSWAPVAAKTMAARLEKCKNLRYSENTVKITAALDRESTDKIKELADELINL